MKNTLIITNIFLFTSFLFFIYFKGYYGPRFCIPFEHADHCFYLYLVIKDTIGIFTIIFLPVSILVCFCKDSVVIKWWKFARIAIPAILIISTIINLGFHHHPGGFMNLDNMFDIPAQMLMYGIFVIGSVIQIVRGYRVSRAG